MKTVTWEDNRGYKHAALLRDKDPDDAVDRGIPLDPPDINQLDWDYLRKELHNTLVDMGILTWEDVVKHQNGVSGAILRVFKRPVVQLYRDGG